MNHTYKYQSKNQPNRFWFTPDQVARCCLEFGRAKDSDRAVSPIGDELVVSLRLTKMLIEQSCRSDVGSFHGSCGDGSTEKYVHGKDGSLTIEIHEPPS